MKSKTNKTKDEEITPVQGLPRTATVSIGEWEDAGNLKELKRGELLRVTRKGKQLYGVFKFDGVIAECDYAYDSAKPFAWLEVGMVTLDKFIFTRKDHRTGAVYADNGDKVEKFQIGNKLLLSKALPAQIGLQECSQERYEFEKFWVEELGTADDLTYGGLGYALNRVSIAWEAYKAGKKAANQETIMGA